MKYKIEKGDKFLCLSDYMMNDDTIAYTGGNVYLSESDDCITDDSLDSKHRMDGQDDFFEFFKLVGGNKV